MAGHRAARVSIRRILGIDKRASAPTVTGAEKIRTTGRIFPIEGRERIGGKPEVVPGGTVLEKNKIKGKGRKNK